ncbi:hypothetical protein KY332_01700 [Candidatus Woesearchaeota archaeon]|nr:hypothetical protein [Candidatus Woesearchaeota archaeon]
MVWFDSSLRFQLCEAGISGNVEPIKPCSGKCGQLEIPSSSSSISGFTAGGQ